MSMTMKLILSCLVILAFATQYGYSARTRHKRRYIGADKRIEEAEIQSVCCRIKSLSACCRGESQKLVDDMKSCRLNASSTPLCTDPELSPDNALCICTVPFDERKNIRKFQYCEKLSAINELVHKELIPKLNKYKNCVEDPKDPAKIDNESYQPFSSFVPAVESWHKSFVERYKRQTKCCESRTIKQLSDADRLTIQDIPKTQCLSELVKTINKIIAVMEYVTFVEKLGNKNGKNKKCLRGCFSQDMLDCGDPVFEYFLPTPPTTAPTTAAPKIISSYLSASS